MKKRNAFTLVELLVVIGIIALLISILLPALGKARQQANKASCLSNLHNMGVALAMYENQYKGSFPMSRGQFDSASNEYTWGSLLSQQMGMGNGTAQTVLNASQLSSRGVFICKDGPVIAGAVVANEYSAHPLLMPNLGPTSYAAQVAGTAFLTYPANTAAYGSYAGTRRLPYKVTKLPTPADTACLWDGVIEIGGMSVGGVTQGNASSDGYALDQQRIVNTSPTVGPITFLLTGYSQQTGADLGASVDGGTNVDSGTGSNTDRILGNIRWRHMNNKAANFLFADGHAASLPYSSQYKTGLLRRNVCIPAPH